MKKLIIISVLVVISLNNFSQRVLSFTFSPQQNDVGAFYISNPKFEYRKDYSLYTSFEYGYYKELNSELLRTAFGLSSEIHESINMSLALSLNFFDHESFEANKRLKEISFEYGVILNDPKYENLYISLLLDPLNYHFRFGIGVGF